MRSKRYVPDRKNFQEQSLPSQIEPTPTFSHCRYDKSFSTENDCFLRVLVLCTREP